MNARSVAINGLGHRAEPMCGIAGSFGMPRFNVTAAIQRLRHRGPDGSGATTDGRMEHGHCRLAIQDPTPGSDQPFRLGDTHLAFNGELWNHVALRDILIGAGYNFSTSGDTEVMAAALDHWPVEEALSRMEETNGYTQEEIRRKRLALEGVLVPVTAKWNEELLHNAGFRQVDCFWRWMNFAGWIALK